jgi:multiple sugar transport system permease protein
MENTQENLNVKTQEKIALDVEKEKAREKRIKIVKNVIVYLVLTLFAIFAIFPFYWMIMTSFKGDAEYRQLHTTYWPQENFFITNYKTVFNTKFQGNGSFLINLQTTLIVGLVSTLLSVIVTILTAYAFAKLNFKGRDFMFSLLLSTMMIPGELFTITNYVTVGKNALNWNNTYVVMIVPFMVSVFYVYLLRNSFKQIPNSLYQAAKVDGCSDLGYLLKVMIPLAAPQIISITLLKFIGTWNAYIWPRLVNKTDAKYLLLTNWVASGFQYEGASQSSDTLKMAAATLVTIPLLVLFLCFRKYIMRGVSRSGTKG